MTTISEDLNKKVSEENNIEKQASDSSIKDLYVFESQKEPPRPPVSYANEKETFEEYSKRIYDEESERLRNFFDKVAQEGIIDHTLVGNLTSTSSFNPHNYRLYFNYSFPPQRLVRGLVRGWFQYEKSINYNSEHFFKDTRSETTIRIKPKQAEVRFRRNDFVMINNLKPEEIFEIAKKMKHDAIIVFKQFVHEFGGKADFKPLDEYYLDNALKDNSLTQKQRLKDKFETPLVKKLYNEKKLEYKSLTAAKNAAHNAGLYDFSPEIAERLETLDESFKTLEALTQQINLHLAVEDRQLQNQEIEIKNQQLQLKNQHEMNKLLAKLNNKISEQGMRFLSTPSRPQQSGQLSLQQFYGG